MSEDPEIEIVEPVCTIVRSSEERQCWFGRTTVQECSRETRYVILVDAGGETIFLPSCPTHIAWLVENGLKDELARKTEDNKVNLGGQVCACSRCTEKVSPSDFTFPYCTKCYANIDGRCV